jgi:hypothetical protein
MVALGRKPADYNPAAFSGVHAPYVLVIFDEACGMPSSLFEAGDTLMTNPDARFLAIGNPDDPKSKFSEVCEPGSGWSVIRISAFDTPNFTGESAPREVLNGLVSRLWVKEKGEQWIGSGCPSCLAKLDHLKIQSNPYICPECAEAITLPGIYLSKVLALFPDSDSEGLIRLSWIKAAQERTLPIGPSSFAVDVGGGVGLDKSIICWRRGDHFRIIRQDNDADTMGTCGHVLGDMKRLKVETTKIDTAGIGQGVGDRAREVIRDNPKDYRQIISVNVGAKSSDPSRYLNLRSELWWLVRERFEQGLIDIDPSDDELAGQLASIRVVPRSDGKIQIQSKKDMRKSPDKADALMLSTYESRAQKRLTFGQKRKK